jgi:hypothetical protein
MADCSSHCNSSSSVLCQRCWLLTAHDNGGDAHNGKSMLRHNVHNTSKFFFVCIFALNSAVVSARDIVIHIHIQNVIRDVMCKTSLVLYYADGPCGTFVRPQCYEWTSCKGEETSFLKLSMR